MRKHIIRISAVASTVLALGVAANASLHRAGSNIDFASAATDISAQKRAKAGNVNVKVNKRTNVVVRRPVRVWVRRPYYGAVVGGVVLGTIVAATVVGTAPVATAPNMCWFWADQEMIRGYWDYCVAP